MAQINLSMLYALELTHAEMRLLGLALAAAVEGQPIKNKRDAGAMAALNLKLQELRTNRLRDALARAEQAHESATKLAEAHPVSAEAAEDEQ